MAAVPGVSAFANRLLARGRARPDSCESAPAQNQKSSSVYGYVRSWTSSCLRWSRHAHHPEGSASHKRGRRPPFVARWRRGGGAVSACSAARVGGPTLRHRSYVHPRVAGNEEREGRANSGLVGRGRETSAVGRSQASVLRQLLWFGEGGQVSARCLNGVGHPKAPRRTRCDPRPTYETCSRPRSVGESAAQNSAAAPSAACSACFNAGSEISGGCAVWKAVPIRMSSKPMKRKTTER